MIINEFLPSILVQIEQGMCVDPDNEAYYTCEALEEQSQVFGEVTSCEFSSCEGDNCNQMTIQSDVQCDYTVKEGGMSQTFSWY